MATTTMGARIERARELAGLNKNQLARAVSTSWQHVDHWERDRMLPSTTSLQRIASVLGVTVAYLLGEASPVETIASEALETFLRSYAPPDLAPEELAWLRAAPIDPRVATPGQYLDLLHRLRTPSPRAEAPRAEEPVRTRSQPPPVRTGRRAKVQVEDALALDAKKGRRGA